MSNRIYTVNVHLRLLDECSSFAHWAALITFLWLAAFIKKPPLCETVLDAKLMERK